MNKQNVIKQCVYDAVSDFGIHPYELIHGRCADFRDVLSGLLHEKKIGHDDYLWDDHIMPDSQSRKLGIVRPGHTFVIVDGLYYDAAEPNGVVHHLLLPSFAQQVATHYLKKCSVI